MSCHTGEAVGAIQGWDHRAGTLTSPPSTPSLEVTCCRAGVCPQRAEAPHGSACDGDSSCLSVVWICLSVRLGMVDPDLPPPGPPTLKSFKVGAPSAVVVLKQPQSSSHLDLLTLLPGVPAQHGRQHGRDGVGQALQPV